jgi:hypothetical protein
MISNCYLDSEGESAWQDSPFLCVQVFDLSNRLCVADFILLMRPSPSVYIFIGQITPLLLSRPGSPAFGSRCLSREIKKY